MKLLIIFNKDIEISPEKICVHVGHSNRDIMHTIMYYNDYRTHNFWADNDFKTVLLKDKITDKITNFIRETRYYSYKIFEAGTILSYAVLIPKNDETFKRLRTLKF